MTKEPLIQPKISTDQNAFDFYEILYFFKRNYLVIIVATLVSLLIGCFITLRTKPVYIANAKLLIEKKDEDALGMGSIALEGLSDKSAIQDKIEILKSRTISEEVIRKLSVPIKSSDGSLVYRKMFALKNKPYEPKGYRKTFNNFLYLWGLLYDEHEIVASDNIKDLDIKYLATELQKRTVVNNIKGTNIISVTIESLDYDESEELVDLFISAYIQKEKEWANLEIQSQINFLENQILKKRINLNAIEDLIQAYQEEEDIYSEDGNSSLLLSNFIELENKYNKEKILYKDLEYRKTLFAKELNKQDIPKSYELAVKDSIRNFNILIEISNSRIDNINSQLLDNERTLDELPEKIKNFVRLKRDRLILDNTLMQLEERMQSAKIILESESGPAKLIVEPQKQNKSIRPTVFINLLFSIFFGFSIICVILYAKDLFDFTIGTIEDLESYGLNVLAIIPSIGNIKKNKNKVVKNGKELARRLILSEDPKSPVSEAYRTLRTSIMYSSSDNNVIMISSPGPGEGKTTSICNLAITYANLGKKTLLIDADLRKPVINKVFELDKSPGLTNYIAGDEILEKICQKTYVDNLDIVTSGISTPNPAELLNSSKMKDLLSKVKSKYDIVLIDTPPMIAVTDALILSNLADCF
ncbi:MAG: hypothetical protein CBD97_01155, partial [Pelagibacteraceae bacterium TMED237]